MIRPSKESIDEAHRSTIERHIANGDLGAIEEIWLAQVQEDPLNLSFFVPVAQALGTARETETAHFLLELLDDQLTEKGEWSVRLELLRRAAHLLIDADSFHSSIIETLEKVYGDRPSYEQMAEKVGMHRAVEDHAKTWKKAQRLAGLLAFDIGSIVHMEGKGGGRVEAVNMELESFKVTFEDEMVLQVGFGGAHKLLQPLAPEHILYKKMVDPDSLLEMKAQAPNELLHLVFSSYDKPLTGAQIKRILAGVVLEKKWNSWWTAARKHPQVIASTKVKRAYEWAESTADAQGAVWRSFTEASPRGQMDLLRRDGARDQELLGRMSTVLEEQAAQAVAQDPGLACEIWFALERSGEVPPTAEWSPQSLVSSLKDLRPMLAGIQARPLRERTYELLREQREDWTDLYAQMLLQEKDARALDILTESLEESAPQHLDSFFDLLLSQPKKNPPAFVWFLERAADRPEWLGRNPVRMVKQLLFVLNDDSFASYRAARLMPLVESGGTLPRLLSHLDQAQAEEVATTIEKTGNLEDYQRKPLITAIHLRFPELRQEEEEPLYATLEKIAAKRVAMKELVEVEIPANRRAIEEARELGDLRENFEYKSARQRHEYLSARASALNHDLTRVRPIDPTQVTGSEVVIGSKIQLTAENGTQRVITILGPWESEPEKDILSSESEMAKSLLGLTPGDSIELVGESYRIETIEPYE